MQIRDLIAYNQLMKAESEAEVVQLKSKNVALEIGIENKTSTLLQVREEFEKLLAKEREIDRKLTTDNHDLQSKCFALDSTISK